jgi:hypothetical protein
MRHGSHIAFCRLDSAGCFATSTAVQMTPSKHARSNTKMRGLTPTVAASMGSPDYNVFSFNRSRGSDRDLFRYYYDRTFDYYDNF